MTTTLDKDAERLAFAERLNKAMEYAGFTSHGRGTTLAARFNITPKAGNKWLNGETMPEASRLAQLANWLGVSVLWLWQGAGHMILSDALNEIGNNYKVRRNPQEKKIPVISWVQAGAFTDFESILLEEVTEWLPWFPGATDNSFGLIVNGDSMEPYFVEGDRIVINPDKASDANNKDLVIAICDQDEKATFKKFVVDGSDKFLVAMNPDWIGKKFIEFTQDCNIKGLVIGQFRYLNKRTFQQF